VYARSGRNPLGETGDWGMKASLQRDYIGVREKRVVQEEEPQGSHLRLMTG
jgi:hypothetical protein